MTERSLRQFVCDRRPQHNHRMHQTSQASLLLTWWYGDPEERAEELPEKVFDLLSKGDLLADVARDYQTERAAWIDLLDALRQT